MEFIGILQTVQTLSIQLSSLTVSTKIEFVSDVPPSIAGQLVTYPAIWETEPNQVSDLNIYYEASGNIPTNISDNKEEIFAPVGCKVFIENIAPTAVISPEQINTIGAVHIAQWSLAEDGVNFKIKLEPGLPAYNSELIGAEPVADYTDTHT